MCARMCRKEDPEALLIGLCSHYGEEYGSSSKFLTGMPHDSNSTSGYLSKGDRCRNYQKKIAQLAYSLQQLSQ